MDIAVYHNLPSGGALLYLSQVVQEMKRRNHRVHLFTPSCAEKEFASFLNIVDSHTELKRELWDGKYSFFNPFFYKLFLKQSIQQEREFAKLIASKNVDGLYLGQCRIWTEPPLLSFLPENISTILYCNEPKRSFYEARSLERMQAWPWWKKIWRMPTIRWMKETQYKNVMKAHHVFCNSKFSKERIEKAYPSLTPEVHYIGVDTESFKPNEQIDKQMTLCSVGALDPSKNHQMAIDVAAQKPGGKKFKVVLITDRSFGDTADHLKKRAKDQQVDLEIKVRVSSEELILQYQKSFAIIYCPILEPFGLVSIEAQACGTPILGRDEGGLKETIQIGHSGYRFFDQVGPYVEQIQKWLQQPDEYEQICKRARKYVLQNWDQNKLVQDAVRDIESYFSTPN